MNETEKKPAVLLLLGNLAIGGSETKFANLANRLVRAGLPVHLAYLEPPESLLNRLDGVPVINLQRKSKWSFGAFSALSKYVSKNNIKTIIAVNTYPLVYAVPLALINRKGKIRVIASINTSEIVSKRERAFMKLYALLLRKCASIVFGSKSQQLSWNCRYELPDKGTVVVYNGVDPGIFDRAAVMESRYDTLSTLEIPESAYVIVCVGQLRPEKAHGDLLEAISMLKKQHDFAPHVIIVGDGPERSKITHAAVQLELSERVHLVGAVQDVRPFLKASDLFVLTSTTETFSNAALEASAMGLPAILSDVGGAKEMFPPGSSGVVYPREQLSHLVSALAAQMRSGKLTDGRANEVREETLRRFSIDNMDSAWKSVIWPDGVIASSAQAMSSRNSTAN